MTTSVGGTQGLLSKDLPHPTYGVGCEDAVKLTLLFCCCHIILMKGSVMIPSAIRGRIPLLLPCLSHLQIEMKSVVQTLKLVRHLRLRSP